MIPVSKVLVSIKFSLLRLLATSGIVTRSKVIDFMKYRLKLDSMAKFLLRAKIIELLKFYAV